MLIGCARGQDDPPRPNVLFVCVDDLNDFVGCLGGPGNTPAIDALAARGMLFLDAHCPAPLCGPSRAAVLSGLRPTTTGIYGNRQWLHANHPDIATIPSHFKRHGYRVLGAGKVTHHTAGNNPPAQWHAFQRLVFDDPWDRRNRTNYPWTTPTERPAGHPFSRLPFFVHEFDWGPIPKLAPEQYADHQTTDWCIAQLAERAKQPKQPFFLACGLFRPHMPWYAPKTAFDAVDMVGVELPDTDPDDLADLPEEGKLLAAARREDFTRVVDADQHGAAVHGYLAAMHAADQQLGRLLAALDASPFKANTILVLWSDHGFHLGEKQHWHKNTLWQRSTHVPLIVVAPGLTRPGTQCDEPVSTIDLFATLADLCGLPTPSTDGSSLRPQLARSPQPAEPALVTCGRGNHALITATHRYIRYAAGGEELYDRKADPLEQRNLIGAGFEEILEELRAALPQEEAEPALPKSAFAFDKDTFTFEKR